MKDGSRFLGIDDASFEHCDEETSIIGVVYRGVDFIEDIVSNRILIDSDDAVERVVEVHNMCGNPSQISAVLTDGISVAGFNIIDVNEVSERIGKPVVAVTSNKPDREGFRRAMKNSDNYDERFEELSEPRSLKLQEGTCYYQSSCGSEEAEKIIKSSILHGLTPEPIRVAHMIGRAVKEV